MIKTIPKKNKHKLKRQNGCLRRTYEYLRKQVKGKGEKERYTHLNAEFQRIARRDKKAFLSVLGVPCGSAGKESACHVGDLGLIPGLGRFPGEGNSYPLQYSGLENSMNRGA